MTTFAYFGMTAKDSPPRHDEGGEVMDEEKVFAERLKIEVRRPGARAPSDEVAHELEAQW